MRLRRVERTLSRLQNRSSDPDRSPPQTAVVLMSASSSSSSRRIGIRRATAFAWMPTARQEPSAARSASKAFGAMSSLSKPLGFSSITGCGGKSRTQGELVKLALGDSAAAQSANRCGISSVFADRGIGLGDPRRNGRGCRDRTLGHRVNPYLPSRRMRRAM